MARKSKGYVELFWTCPNCSGENFGSASFCAACGGPQPEGVDFHQAPHGQLITDEEKLKRAKAGADIHCGFCGTRNPASAKACSQCGADLSEGAQRASAGRVVGAFKQGEAEPVTCPSCGTVNDGHLLECESCGSALPRGKQQAQAEAAKVASPAGNRNLILIGGALVLAACALIYFLFIRTTELEGEVSGVSWERSVAIEAFGAVERENWRDEIPSDAEVLSCSEEVRSVEAEAPIGARYDEVCGTPYTVETGSGFAEVVQDCEYQVYADYCTYRVDDWAPVATQALQGNDLSPAWPSPNLSSNQRLGEQSETYACIFDVNGERYTYATDSAQEFQQCALGSTWTLSVNALGAVTSIER